MFSLNGFRYELFSRLSLILYLVVFCIACLNMSEAIAADTDTTIISLNSEEGRLAKSSRLLRQSLFNIDDDLKGIALYPFENPKETLFFLGGIGALVAVDKPVTMYYQDKVEPLFNGYNLKTPKLAKGLGVGGADAYLTLGVAGSYLLGIAFNDEKSQQAALLATKANAYSILVSHLILKPIFGRKRPVPNLSTATGGSSPYTTNPYAFGHFHRPHIGPFQDGTGMPSYHFTSYFAMARVYSKVYDNYLIPYGVTAALLTSNIKGHRHWVGDMVAGALIGTMIGNVVSDNAFKTETPSTLLVPSFSGGQISLNFYHQF